MGGDFRQILPVVKKGVRGDIVSASLNHSGHIWQHVRVFSLHHNMRVARLQTAGDVAGARELQSFADYLQRLGEGTEQAYPVVGEDSVLIPPAMHCTGGEAATIDNLIEDVYGGLRGIDDPAQRTAFITERAILTPLNHDVDRLNRKIMSTVDFKNADGTVSDIRLCKSADCVVEGEQTGVYPTEFLNSLKFSGCPPHELHLRVGCPIILLRNMTGGLANGTRLIVRSLQPRLIEAIVATGPMQDRVVYIPRIDFTMSEDEGLPFTLRRRQFPVRPAFAMSVNKAQGQTLKAVGVYLPKPVFTHGQLYVAFSRVGSPRAIKVLVEGGWVHGAEGAPDGMYTKNVVYKEVFVAAGH
jgi:ATP-dependent DNA helicase PIF1